MAIETSFSQDVGPTEQDKKTKKMRSVKLAKGSSTKSSARQKKASQFEWTSSDLYSNNSSPKKKSSQGESESEVSVNSSIYGSTSSATSSLNEASSVKKGTDQNKTPKNTAKSTLKLARTSSMRTVRILKNKTSLKSKKPSIEKSSEISQDLSLERATYSSTLKDLKLPKQIELPPSKNESEKNSVCPYHHCSLHGHHHHHHNAPEATPKRVVYQNKRPLKPQESVSTRGQSTLMVKRSGNKKEVKAKDLDYSIEFYAKTKSEPFIGVSQDHGDVDIAEIMFGVKSLEGNLNEIRRSCMEERDILETHELKETENDGVTSSASNFHHSEREEKNGDADPDGEFVIGPTQGVEAKKSMFKNNKQMSMWHVIHQHMVSGLAAEAGNKLLEQADEEKQFHFNDANTLPETETKTSSSDSDMGTENQEIELRKMFAVKLVREAIEKILLPEVQDDQSVTSEAISEKNHGEGEGDELSISTSTDSTDPEKATDTVKVDTYLGMEIVYGHKEEKTTEEVGHKYEKRTPKSWSYLKKVILLKRFIKELENVKKFNPKKPRHLPLEAEPEAETVSLRPQRMGEKRNSDEWMLDYALRRVVSELAPTQKRKVALLVRAFETVAPPPKEDHEIKVTVPKLGESIAKDSKTCYKTNCDPSEQLIAARDEKNRESEPEGIVDHEFPTPTDCKLNSTAKGENGTKFEKQNHIKMWHMIYQHVVADVAAKVGAGLLLDGADEEVLVDDACSTPDHGESKENYDDNHHRLEFSRSDAVKLVREAVDEILLPEIQDDSSSDTLSIASDITPDQELLEKNEGDSSIDHISKPEGEVGRNRLKQQKSKNWSKLKKLILLKRSIKALEKVRKVNPRPPQPSLSMCDLEAEQVDLRSQMMDERKKAEQWMLDYAVQHMVTKLTPARKTRVAMLVEAFEAVVPLPQI